MKYIQLVISDMLAKKYEI